MNKRMFRQGRFFSLLAAVFLLIFSAGIAAAKEAVKVSDEKKLNTEISFLNKDASMLNGDRIVIDELSKEFKVRSDQITALRDRNLGYGQIAAVYAFADKMPGGVNDENVNKVMSMQGKERWGKIASNLNVDLGAISNKLTSIEKSVHDGIRQASAEMPESGAATGGGSDESEAEPDRSAPLYQ